RARARRRPRRARRPPRHADAQAARPAARRRAGELPLQPHPHPRRRVPGPPEADAGDAARALRRVGRPREPRPRPRGRVRGDPRVPPRAGAPIPERARAARRPRSRARPARGGAARVGGAAGDDRALAKAWRLLASVHGRACRFEEEAKAGRQAMEHARRAGDRRQELRSAAALAMSRVYGPTPVPAALAECERVLEEARGDRRAEGLVLGSLARLHALAGDFERARDAYRRARAVLEDLGSNVLAASLSLDSHAVELLAGDPAAAERELRRDYDALD